METEMKVLYADSMSELNLKSIGLNHDHCYHYYRAKTSEVPEKYKKHITENKEYCFMYKENIPND